MTPVSRLQLALAVASLVSLVGCAQCGDAIICPPAASVDFTSSQVPTVRVQEDAVRFELPRSLNRYPKYGLGKVYVYEAVGEKVVWQLDAKSHVGLTKLQKLNYDPRQPLIYGHAVEGTVQTVPPAALQAGTVYNMRGTFNSYETSDTGSGTYVKVTFRVRRENGQLRVEQLPTRREG
ncbi:MAG: hypothetical protein JWQ72_706 [Polaromonas sp.]|nr:hypothetical protein [Polaromonas sp.]